MRQFKTLEQFIFEYGDVDGPIKHNKAVHERESRLLRKNGKSINVDLSTELNQTKAIENGDAVKCLECGYVGTRLQHTHFKYKCTGKFTSGREYMIAYPGAKVVSPNLAKSTGGTLANYIIKYGEEEGRIKWDEYKTKQADSNSFTYKQNKNGWTKEQYDEYNANRASTLENFIKRHGLEEGTRLRNEYIKRQRYTISIEYFIETYGVDEGTKKYKIFDDRRCEQNSTRISKPEQELFNILNKYITGDFSQQVKVISNDRTRIFDMGSLILKKLIEYNGSHWHADPLSHKADWMNPSCFLTAQEIWDRDNRKLKTALDNGFEVLVIWDRDWKKTNQKETIKRILKWWYGEDYVI